MRKPDRSNIRACFARSILLAASTLLLAGCATGYSFVQPDMVGSGSYYTSDGPYTGQGYYDYYATGPYYPGTSGWGYYNGTWPYSDSSGWYGGYGSSLTFGFGISNTWGFPGYWGPWYSSGYPAWGCYGCGGWRHRHHNRHDPSRDKPKPWLQPDHSPVPPRIARGSGSAPPVAFPDRPLIQRPMEGFADRRPLESTAFAPHDFAREPVRRPVETAIGAVPIRRAWVPQRPNESAFAFRRDMRIPPAALREPRPVSQPVFRPRTPPPVQVTAPPPRRDQRVETKIP